MTETNDFLNEELLFQVLSLIAPLTISIRKQISSYLKTETYPKKHRIIRQGVVSRQVFFIVNGNTRSFHTDEEGRESTLRFSGQMEFVSSVYSFFNQKPALENVETLQQTTVLSITWNQLQTIYGEHPEFNYHGRILIEKYYTQAELRTLIIKARTPRERYRLLLKHYPKLLQSASLGQVASFIGVTPETLSRIRAIRRI